MGSPGVEAPVEEAIDISKSYKDVIFRNLTLRVPPRGLIFVHGPNGSGKSTLLRVMALHEMPDSGEMRLMGKKVEDVRVANYHEYAKFISFSFQEPLLLPISVRENLEIPTQVNEERKAELIKEFRLEPLLNKKATKLSGGERKRVDIIRAVVRETPILILDEPLAFLDPEYRELVIGLVLEEAERRAVIVSATERLGEFAEAAVERVDMLEVKG